MIRIPFIRRRACDLGDARYCNQLATVLRWAGHRHLVAALVVGFVIGFYDGALGPGTGSFLLFSLVAGLGLVVYLVAFLRKLRNPRMM